MALTVNPSTLQFLGPVDNNVNPNGISKLYSDEYFDRVVVAPSNLKQIGGFAFDYEGDDMVTTESEATDHWLEDNVAVQDHIGLKPVIITLRGFTSELALNNNLGNQLINSLNAVQTTLTTVIAYTGKYNAGTLAKMQTAISQAQNIAIQIEQAVSRGLQILSLFQGPKWTKQQQAYAALSALQNARVVFSVFTPYRIYNNMIIISLKALQSEKSKTMTDFTVVMKQLNFSDNTSVAGYNAKKGGRATNNQTRNKNGSTSGLATPRQVLSNAFPGVVPVGV